MSFATLLYDRSDDGVATITLNRPQALNAYSVQMRDDLHELLTNLAADDELRVVVFRGAGDRAFCAGADLTEFGTAPSPFAARRIRFARDVWAAVRGIPVPTIAALHGHAIGSGLELALHCNLRIAAASTRLLMPEAALGLLPAAGGTQTLPRIAGTHIAARLLLLGEPMQAQQAAAAGIVDEVVPDDALAETATARARQLAQLPRARLTTLVRLLRLRDERSTADAIRAERTLARLGSC